MKYNINVIKSVWRQLRRPSRATLDVISSQNSQKKSLMETLDSAVRERIARLEADRNNLLTMAKTVVRLRDMNVIPSSEIINGLRDTIARVEGRNRAAPTARLF
jgi:uncharacterized FlgJ-related protein